MITRNEDYHRGYRAGKRDMAEVMISLPLSILWVFIACMFFFAFGAAVIAEGGLSVVINILSHWTIQR